MGSTRPTCTVPQTIRQKALTWPKVKLSTMARKAPWKFLILIANDSTHVARKASLQEQSRDVEDYSNLLLSEPVC